MLIKVAILNKIKAGEVSLVFRNWEKPSVKKGTIFHSVVGQVKVEEITKVERTKLLDEDAHGAGFESLEALLSSLPKAKGDLFKINLSYAGEDPRIALRDSALTRSEFQSLALKLEKMDLRSKYGPWTQSYLSLIRDNPEKRAADLALLLKVEKNPFKLNVRKLKNLGLTESLEIGYRISKRGGSFLDFKLANHDK